MHVNIKIFSLRRKAHPSVKLILHSKIILSTNKFCNINSLHLYCPKTNYFWSKRGRIWFLAFRTCIEVSKEPFKERAAETYISLRQGASVISLRMYLQYTVHITSHWDPTQRPKQILLLVRVTSERSYVFRPSGNINTRITVVYSAEKSDCTDPVAGDVLSHIGYYETKTGDRDKLSYVHKNLRNPGKNARIFVRSERIVRILLLGICPWSIVMFESSFKMFHPGTVQTISRSQAGEILIS
jgi:hypothetical protein